MSSRASLRRLHLAMAALASFVLGASSVHCGGGAQTETGSNAGGSGGSGAGSGTGGVAAGPSGTGGDITIDVQTKDYSAEDFFQDDPPPLSCDGGGMAPPPPGGTPECPSDKNLEGCPCPSQGAQAACWPGLRKNRNHGICHDGMTTCQLSGENQLTWGPCAGAQLPTGNTGKAACGCFSAGHWDIANLSPCFFSQNNQVVATTSTFLVGNNITCPADDTSAPAEDWSTDSLTVDCTGSFKLCYTLKAGDGANPQPSDCTIIQVCTEAYYSPANTKVPFPPLKGWLADPSTIPCAQQFVDVGGYGEMSVDGQSDECEGVKKVFQHVTYCPLGCDPNSPDAGPGCAGCMAGGGGTF